MDQTLVLVSDSKVSENGVKDSKSKGSKVASERKFSDLVLNKDFLDCGEKAKSSEKNIIGREFDLISVGKNLLDCRDLVFCFLKIVSGLNTSGDGLGSGFDLVYLLESA